MIDLDRIEKILDDIQAQKPNSKEDMEYMTSVNEELKKLLSSENYRFPEWMDNTFLGYAMGAMLSVFIKEHPLEFVRAYLFFKRSQKEKENGRD